ncbi:MAG: hypothetical protein ACR2NU_11565, partial [Aeoliella sp.]
TSPRVDDIAMIARLEQQFSLLRFGRNRNEEHAFCAIIGLPFVAASNLDGDHLGSLDNPKNGCGYAIP